MHNGATKYLVILCASLLCILCMMTAMITAASAVGAPPSAAAAVTTTTPAEMSSHREHLRQGRGPGSTWLVSMATYFSTDPSLEMQNNDNDNNNNNGDDDDSDGDDNDGFNDGSDDEMMSDMCSAPYDDRDRKSKLTAFLLSIFLGIVGADRFYMEYYALVSECE